MRSRLRRVRSVLLSPIPLLLLSGAVYALYWSGEYPRSPSYDGLMPFRVAAEKPADGPSVTLTARTLLVEQRTRTGQTQPFFDDDPASGFFTVSFKSSRPIAQTFRFALDARLTPTRFSIGEPSREGRSESAFRPISAAAPKTADGRRPAAWTEPGRPTSVDDFSMVVVPVHQRAGEYMLTVAFDFPVSTVRYHQHWGENKIFLEIEDSLYEFREEYPDLDFVDPAKGATPVAGEIWYREYNDSITLSDPAPDVESASLRSMRWVRDNGGISVQFLAVDNTVAFWMDRIADLAILILGAAVGILLTPSGSRDPGAVPER
ncbi:hypothetical protein [Nonomuraea sp. NPDC005692]|uniref:hypothetical protein n=1 Tax=Nonomuraea sp. NPDC005692 TaxID=3157168 RepID=UPI00340218A0